MRKLSGIVCLLLGWGIASAHADIASVEYVEAVVPTVNNATLTVQKNGTTVDTFTANASVDKTINITVPTSAADLNAVPTSRTVNSKALSSDITLTASDVGADASGTAAGLVGTLSNLTTTDKTNVVAAINEVKGSISNIDTGVASVTEGTANGTIKVDGTDVAVHGLGTAAYTASTAYATTAQGTKADSAIQSVKVNGTALTPDSNKAVDVTVPTSAADLNAVPTSRTVNSKALSSDITLTASDVGAEATANKSTSLTYETDWQAGKGDVNYPTIAAAYEIAASAAENAAASIVDSISDDGSGGNVVVDVFPNDGVIGFTRGFAYDTIDVIGEGNVVTEIGQGDDDNVIVATMGTLSASDVGAVASSQATKGGVLTTNATTGAVEVSSTIAASKVSGLATVATTGAYSDLTGAPTIPTVNDATLTIQKNGTAVDTFTANASVNKTINITVPTTAADVDAVPTSRTVNSKALSSDVTLAGADIALTGYTKPNATSAVAAADTVNAAIGKLEAALDGKQASGSYVPTTTTVNGHALSSNVTVTKGDVGLGNVANVDTTNAANISSGTMDVARLPVGTTSTTVAAGNDARFDSVPTTQPSGTPPTGRAWVWFD